uniref:centromere protein K isoform X3 n=1 Tax=Pristiophorus japonicus TaxID=55135 RepID=UPI00398EA4BA
MDLQDEILQEAEDLAKRSALYQSRLPRTLVGNTRLSDKAEEELLEECNEAWRELGEFQNKLTLADASEVVQDSENPLAVLLARERALLAELSVQKDRISKPLLINQEVLTCLGKQELQNADAQLEMILSCVRSRKKTLQQELEREQRWLQEQLEMEKSLQEKRTEHPQFLTLSENSVVQKMKLNMEKVTSQKEKLLSALGNFLDEHYPLPNQARTSGKKKRLMTKAMKSPHDPYVELDDRFWPPYVEALLRYGVVSRHAEDPQRIRLEPFNE